MVRLISYALIFKCLESTAVVLVEMSYSPILEQEEIFLVILILRILRNNLFNRLPRLNEKFHGREKYSGGKVIIDKEMADATIWFFTFREMNYCIYGCRIWEFDYYVSFQTAAGISDRMILNKSTVIWSVMRGFESGSFLWRYGLVERALDFQSRVPSPKATVWL